VLDCKCHVCVPTHTTLAAERCVTSPSTCSAAWLVAATHLSFCHHPEWTCPQVQPMLQALHAIVTVIDAAASPADQWDPCRLDNCAMSESAPIRAPSSIEVCAVSSLMLDIIACCASAQSLCDREQRLEGEHAKQQEQLAYDASAAGTASMLDASQSMKQVLCQEQVCTTTSRRRM
jgi:hypothetical protein